MLNITVTILILIDGFLQFCDMLFAYHNMMSHNPYFNRWFSAINNLIKLEKAWERSQSLF